MFHFTIDMLDTLSEKIQFSLVFCYVQRKHVAYSGVQESKATSDSGIQNLI